MSVLSGGRKARRRRSWTFRLWLLAAALAVVVVGAAIALNIS
jgi:hypothetical protein